MLSSVASNISVMPFSKTSIPDHAVEHFAILESERFPAVPHSSSIHEEYCSSSPIALKGWSFLFISIDEPSVKSRSFILPSHINPIFQF